MRALGTEFREAGRIASHYGPRLARCAVKAAAEIGVVMVVVATPAAMIIAVVPS